MNGSGKGKVGVLKSGKAFELQVKIILNSVVLRKLVVYIYIQLIKLK